MARKNTYITVTDQFCGAGGSSQGVRSLSSRSGGGLEVKLALNHWKLAIETHNTNFPDTIHDCTDISASDPRRYPSTDILITSPECTNHSLAKGIKIAKKQMDLYEQGKLDAAAERSRATMWDVPRFAEYHKYNAIIVENVVDARKWVMFDSWLHAMYALGYQHKCVYLNSMHCHPTPQSRDRMYIVFWKKGNKAPNLEFTPLAHCPKCETNVHAIQTWKNPSKRFGKYKQQYIYSCPSHGCQVEPYYYAAFNCIDWSDPGTRIGDRAKPLSANTVTRINYGLKKYGSDPMMIVNYTAGYSKSVMDATATMTSNDHHGLLTPFLVDDKQTTGIGFRVRSVKDSTNTMHTDPRVKIVMPFIIKLEHSQRDNNAKSVMEEGSTQTVRQSSMMISNIRPANEALQTQTTCQGMGFVAPMVVEMNRTGECKPASEATGTITAGGINHAMVQAPFITVSRGQSKSKSANDALTTQSQMINHGLVTDDSFNSFMTSYYNGSHCTKHITEEAGSITTNDRMAIVNYKQPKLEDCYYRMLKPPEVKLAMAFDKDYIILGNGRDQVKQCGNAVTPPAMEWLVQQVVESFN